MNGIEVRFTDELGAFTLDAAFRIPATGVSALFGPSGCGKTMILRCLAGLHRPRDGYLSIAGEIWQDGRRFVKPHKRPVGYVFQDANLFAHLSVRDNLLFGARRLAKNVRSPDFDEIVALLELRDLLDRAPMHLSGGERQRVGIGRALLSAPRLLLMDEPLAALDRAAKNEILPYLNRLHRMLSIPIIYVSHDIAEVERLAERMVLIERGRVRTMGALCDLITDPALPFAREPQAAAVIEGRIARHDVDHGLSALSVPGGEIIVPGRSKETGERRRVRILAADVGLAVGPLPQTMSILNLLPARILSAEPMGTYRMTVFLGLGDAGDGARLIAHITRKSWEHLALCRGTRLTALVKSVTLIEQD